MSKKIISANLDAESLNSMGDAMTAQKVQLDDVRNEVDEISDKVDALEAENKKNKQLADEAELLLDKYLAAVSASGAAFQENISLPEPTSFHIAERAPFIKHTQTVPTGKDWQEYTQSVRSYANTHGLDLSLDPFSSSLSQREYDELSREINDEFSRKTSICNKIDLRFLAIATGLQVVKALLYPLVSGQMGFGQKASGRMAHDDPRIKDAQKQAQNRFMQKHGENVSQQANWVKILTQPPPYDVVDGTKAIFPTGLSGKTHRVHTLGHDPILGWVVGTANILTETVTFDKTYAFQTYRVTRIPKPSVTPSCVFLPQLVSETHAMVTADKLNLPAALAAEGIHLKSDQYTKMGLPVPVLSSIKPDYAADLYSKQYDAMCLARDAAIWGLSAMLSFLIDAIIGLAHGLFYQESVDGTRKMYEVRTRKILLVSGTIASASNLVEACILKDFRAVDVGGLLVTASKLFTTPGFILNVKKEFIENKIYQSIESELAAIEESQDNLLDFEFNHSALIGG